MTDTRRPISLLAAIALGLGAALLVLLLGSGPIAAAPAAAGLNPSLFNKCFARDDSAVGTVYSTTDSSAVRNAVSAATAHDVVRLAGTCNGVAAQGGTTQTVLINKVLSLMGGYTATNWITSFPLTQPTTLDAQGLGRVITASADITIGDVSVQHGASFGGDGGGIFAGGNLSAVGDVNILSNTTVVPVSLLSQRSGASRLAPSAGNGDGGGADVQGDFVFDPNTNSFTPVGSLKVSGNSAAGNGGGMIVFLASDLSSAQFLNNRAAVAGGGLYAVGTLHLNNSKVDGNAAINGAGLYTQGGVTINLTEGSFNNASYGGGFWAAISQNQVNATWLTLDSNSAAYGGGINFFQVQAVVSQSTFKNNTASAAGGATVFIDSSGTVEDVVMDGNTAPEGLDEFLENLFGPFPPVVVDEDDTFVDFFGPQAAGANPLAASSVLTGAAFTSNGAHVFLTDTIVSGYPLVFETTTAPTSTIHGDYNLFDAAPVISGTNVTTGTHSLVGNPMFADAAGHLSAGSPAINHGIDVGINVDLDGNPRPSGGGFDIGAYEFQVALLKLFLPLVMR